MRRIRVRRTPGGLCVPGSGRIRRPSARVPPKGIGRRTEGALRRVASESAARDAARTISSPSAGWGGGPAACRACGLAWGGHEVGGLREGCERAQRRFLRDT